MEKLILAVAACALYGVSAGAQSEAPKPADARVESVVHSLTLEEIIAMPRVHLTRLEMSDGPLGVRSNSQGAGENNGYRVFIDNKLLFDNWELAKAKPCGAK